MGGTFCQIFSVKFSGGDCPNGSRGGGEINIAEGGGELVRIHVYLCLDL